MKMRDLFVSAAVAASMPLMAWNGSVLVSTSNTSMLLHADEGSDLRFAYYGERIDESEIHQIHDAWDGLNQAAYPAFGEKVHELTALQVVHADGNMTLELTVQGVQTHDDGEAVETVVTLADGVYPFTVDLHYRAYKDVDVIESWATYKHNEKKDVVLKRFDSFQMPIRQGDVWISHLYGSWAAEASVSTEPLLPGIKEITNIDGSRNGHLSHPDVMISLDGKPQENHGRVYGAVLCWSGNFKLRFQTEYRNVHKFFIGMNDEASEYRLARGEVFETPRVALTYTAKGLGGASRNYHRWARKHGMVYGSDKPHDVLLNSWEGVYFDVYEPKMDEMMRDFAAIGGEMFVMDDGWFGTKYKRNNDKGALGDWIVDTTKLPNGIQGLVNTADKYGLKFGIWIEPEATNVESVLYEKHPDWALNVKGRNQHYGRGGGQMLLDLCNPEVQDFIYNMVDTLLTNYPGIAYIKWDANVELKNYGSSYLPEDKQSHIYIDYHRGLVNVLKRIRAKHPDVVIQACGGGGGRVSYGVMPYFDEFWVSDNTDALQRIYIQWGTSYFYPANAMAQHVSASPNHQTGRVVPLKFRFDVAMSGRLGMEMQPGSMSEKEREYAKKTIAEYKEILRPIVQQGNLYRLVSPYDRKGYASLMYTNDDGSRAIVFAYKMEHFNNMLVPRLRLDGLDASRTYEFRELSVPVGENPSHLNGKRIKGAILMNTGFEIPLDREYSSRVYELVAVD